MTSTSTSNKQPSDRLLFLRLKTKDQAAFMRAYEAHRAGIYRFIYFRVNSEAEACLLYTSPSPRDRTRSRMPSSA